MSVGPVGHMCAPGSVSVADSASPRTSSRAAYLCCCVIFCGAFGPCDINQLLQLRRHSAMPSWQLRQCRQGLA